MNSKNKLGITLIVIGILLILVSLLADTISIGNVVGANQNPEFGPYQIIALVVGVVVAGIGLYLKNKKDVKQN
jgi:hypothetical protein